jgi:hypothetical protein
MTNEQASCSPRVDVLRDCLTAAGTLNDRWQLVWSILTFLKSRSFCFISKEEDKLCQLLEVNILTGNQFGEGTCPRILIPD